MHAWCACVGGSAYLSLSLSVFKQATAPTVPALPFPNSARIYIHIHTLTTPRNSPFFPFLLSNAESPPPPTTTPPPSSTYHTQPSLIPPRSKTYKKRQFTSSNTYMLYSQRPKAGGGGGRGVERKGGGWNWNGRAETSEMSRRRVWKVGRD